MTYAYATTSAPGMVRVALNHALTVDISPDQAEELARALTEAAGAARFMTTGGAGRG